MSNIKPVQILNGIQDLVEDPACRPLLQPHLVGHHPKQLALLCELVDDEHMVCGLDDLVEVDDVGVPHFFHDVDLSLDADLVVLVLNAVLIDYLYRHFLSGWDMYGLLDLAEGSLAQCLSQLVIAYP